MNYAISGDSVKTLNKDLREARTCFNNRAYKATMVLCGSVIEQALLDRLSLDSSASKNAYRTLFGVSRVRQINRWSLKRMLLVGQNINLINPEIYRLADQLRDYRNLIHPAVSRRTLMVANRNRAETALLNTKRTITYLETNFRPVWQDVYVINIRNIPSHFVDNNRVVQTAISNFIARRGLNFHAITSYRALIGLLQNPPRNIIIINTHGEIMPVPTGRNWSNYYRTFGNVVKDNGWIFVNVGGYPFFYTRNTNPRNEAGPDGLNTFLSVVQMSGACSAPILVEFTPKGLGVIRNANMAGLPNRMPGSRCVKYNNATQEIVFLRNGSFYAASATRIGRGWFVDIGLSSILWFGNAPTQIQLTYGDQVLGNLGIACALSVADRL